MTQAEYDQLRYMFHQRHGMAGGTWVPTKQGKPPEKQLNARPYPTESTPELNGNRLLPFASKILDGHRELREGLTKDGTPFYSVLRTQVVGGRFTLNISP